MFIDLPGPTLSAWVNHWLAKYAPLRCAAKTLERYGTLARYVTGGSTPEMAAVADMPLAQVRHVQLEGALLSLVDAPAERRAHLSAHTIRHIGALLYGALKKAERLDLIRENPMLKVDLPRVEKPFARSLTTEEIHALRRVCHCDTYWTFIELALATGCRRGELLALEWTDVDWRMASITISKALEQTKKQLRVKTTKGGRPRMCKLPQSAIDALTRQLAIVKGNLVFSDKLGGYLKPDLVSQTIKRRLHWAGIENASLHTLRHTHASHLLSRGVPLPAVAARLGHADSNITAKIYAHALPYDDDRAAEAWSLVIAAA